MVQSMWISITLSSNLLKFYLSFESFTKFYPKLSFFVVVPRGIIFNFFFF